MICRICVKYAHLVHLLHFYLPQGANFRKFYSKGSILPGSACTCREKRSGKEGKHPSTSTSSLGQAVDMPPEEEHLLTENKL